MKKSKENIGYGYCECGCGGKTRIAPQNCKTKLWTRGKPIRFIRWHQSKNGAVSKEKNPRWQGDNVSIDGLHKRISKELGKPKICWECGTTDKTKRYEWANISGEYKVDMNDFKRLCKKCHIHFDNVIFKGEDNGMAKLTKKIIIQIRKIYAKNKYSYLELSKMFNINRCTIRDIIVRKTWAHVQREN